MKRVLLIGLDPATVDYSDPALPPGMNAEKIHEALAAGEGVAPFLSEKGDAELAFHNHWWMIQARHEIVPTALPRWLEIVLGIATRL